MTKTILSLCAAALLLASASSHAKDNGAAQRNYQATRDYYASLVHAKAPSQAELNVFVNLLPKGGDLHHHYSGAVYVEDYLDVAERAGYCIYNATDAAAKAEKFRVETRFVNAEAPKNCLKVDAVRRDIPFYGALLRAWSTKDFYNHSHESVPPDQAFFSTFGYFDAVSRTKTGDSLALLKTRAKAENLQYLETMLHSAPDLNQAVPAELAARIDALGAQAAPAERDAAFAALADFIVNDPAARARLDAYVGQMEGDAAGIDDADFTLRFQAFVNRGRVPSRVFASMVNAFLAAQKSPRIVGVNIVAPEHGTVALRDYALHMQMFAFLKKRYPDVKLSLHAGELTLGLVTPEHLKSHIRGALDAGAARIGHGVDISFEDRPDELLARMRRQRIPVEINLTSNAFILGVQAAQHPLPLYLRHGVPVVISTDDPGVSRNDLTGEYLLFVTRYQPSYATLKEVVTNSIRYSFLSEADKKAEMAKLASRFAIFEARVAALAKEQRKSVRK